MTLVLRGYKEFYSALQHAEKDSQIAARTALRQIGESVREDAQSMFSNYGSPAVGATSYGGNRASHADSAEGFKVKVRKRGVDVEQVKDKTPGFHGFHGEYAWAQMKHGLLPALEKNRHVLQNRMEQAMETWIRIFEKRTL